jgi:hypothetical protein
VILREVRSKSKMSKPPLGPAFIQATKYIAPRERHLISCGYEWRDATIGTAAGWVRPSYDAKKAVS